MANEKPETTQNIITPPTGDREKEKRLLEALKAIPDEEIIRLGEERDEEERLKEEAKRREEEKKGEIPQELEDFRKKWEEKINLDEDKKKVIIEAANSIPVKVETESDGSRLIEFKLGNKIYKILDPKLKTHSDEKYWYNPDYDSIIRIDDTVLLEGMRGDDVYKRENHGLIRYVLQKQIEGLHIPSKIEMKILLGKLGKEIDSAELSDQIAMLMYLTGMDGGYRLSMEDSSTRSLLECYDYHCGFAGSYAYKRGNLCMIAYKSDISDESDSSEGTFSSEDTLDKSFKIIGYIIGFIGGSPVEYDESKKIVKFGGETFDLNSFEGKMSFKRRVSEFADLIRDEDARKVMLKLNI